MTEQELLRELSLLRQRIKELEQLESRHRQAEEELKRSEEQYRTLVEKMQDAVYRADLNGNLIFTTPSAARILGYSSVEEMIGLNLADHFYHDPEEAQKHWEILQKQGVLTQYEVTLKRRDTGKPVTVSANTQFYRDKEGNIIGIEGVYSDITARKRAEEQLLESEEKFSRMFRMSPDIMTISRLSDGEYIEVNDEFTRQVGYGREETIGRTSLDLGIWVDSMDRDRVIGLLQEKGEINNDEFLFRVKDGRVVIGEMSAKAITLGGEQCLLSIFREITEKVEARKALAESEERFRSVVEKSLVGIAIIDDAYRYLYVNEELCRIAGYSEQEMLGRDFTFSLTNESKQIVAERFQRRQRGEDIPSHYEFSFRQKSGSERIGEVHSAVYHDSSGKVKTLIQVIDTTESKQADEALRKSEAYFRAITENASDILVISDMDGIITYASPSIERIAGYSPEELTGVNFFELIVPEDVPRVMEDFARALQTQNTYIPNSFRVRHKDGSEIVLEGVGANLIDDPVLTGFVMNARDITERKRIEDTLREKERLFDLITGNMSDMIRITDLQGHNLYVSPSHYKGLGYRMEERVGKPVFDIVHPEDLERMIKAFADGLTSKRAVITEYRVRHADGHYVWLETVADLLKNEQGEVNAAIMCSRDVSERKQTENALLQSEERFRDLFENSLDLICIHDFEGRFLSINAAGAAMFGHTIEELIGKKIPDFLVPQYREDFYAYIDHIKEHGSATGLMSILSGKGERRILEYSNNLSIEPTKTPTIRGIVRDITERWETAKALHESEHKYRSLFENATEGIYQSTPEGRFLSVNPAMARISGYDSPEEMISSISDISSQIFMNPQERAEFQRILESGGIVQQFEVRHKKKDGTIIWLALHSRAVRDESGKIIRIEGMAVDITEHKQAEERLQEYQRRLSDIIEFLPDATLVIDGEGKVIAWNRAIEAMTGVKKEEILGKGNYEYSIPFYGERRPTLIDLALRPDPKQEKEYLTIRRMGDLLWGDIHTPALPPGNVHLSGTASVLRDQEGKIVGAIECIRDHTDRKNMEERLQRAEKMESLGILAGGVAHDLNNVLGVLVGYSELLLRDLPEGSRAEKHARNILQGGERAAAIIQDLLTMARRGVSVAETINLNQIVADCFKTPEFDLMKARYPDVRFLCRTEKDLFNIKGSPVHLSKSIMNLLSNAAEAIQGEGTVTIATENRYVDVAIPGYEDTQEGEYVVLTVTDTGSGISPEDMGRLFEPFYTKKVMGRSGTGLGLAVVWGTVKDHRGYIDVQTELNKGTSFVLYFPVTREALSKTDQALAESEYRGKGESILVVDDVEEQRLLAATILEGLNYRVALAASGEEALDHLRAIKADLVVLDMIMDPGIDGMETYRRMLEIRPQQKAIIVSGFARTERVSKAQELGAGEYVKKPYNIEKLGMAVRGELDRGEMES